MYLVSTSSSVVFYLWPFGIELFSLDSVLVSFCELTHLDVGSRPEGDDHDDDDDHDETKQ